MRARSTNDAETLALSALAATLTDERRARRFLDLSGIDTEELRLQAAEPALLAALLRFLEAHEPDLIVVADAMGVKPAELVAAREDLEA
jgi:adenine/guanine phosphoribosyltransferase-like PRPP-binding protein